MIFDWWALNRRDLPWRHTHDPYRILVSEVMLQQTQVSRVLPKYTEFLETFPTIESLAEASSADVLKLWKGMGYNRRALYLKKSAETVVGQFAGKFPDSELELLKLPGLGIYTTRAIMVFAYRQDVAMVDTNVRQIITHFFFNGLLPSEKEVYGVADTLVPKGKSWEWHQALMDFGALKMKRLRPLARHSRESGNLRSIPFKETNRFYRGRIMDTLREGNMREFVLIKEFQEKYDKPEDFLVSIIDGLVKDALVSRRAGMLQLPD